MPPSFGPFVFTLWGDRCHVQGCCSPFSISGLLSGVRKANTASCLFLGTCRKGQGKVGQGMLDTRHDLPYSAILVFAGHSFGREVSPLLGAGAGDPRSAASRRRRPAGGPLFRAVRHCPSARQREHPVSAMPHSGPPAFRLRGQTYLLDEDIRFEDDDGLFRQILEETVLEVRRLFFVAFLTGVLSEDAIALWSGGRVLIRDRPDLHRCIHATFGHGVSCPVHTH